MGNGKVPLDRNMLLWLETLTVTLGIRNFIVGITVKVASDETTLRREKTYVNKLNLALVQVSDETMVIGLSTHFLCRS